MHAGRFHVFATTGQSQGRPGLCHAVKVSQPKVLYQRHPTSMHEIAEGKMTGYIDLRVYSVC